MRAVIFLAALIFTGPTVAGEPVALVPTGTKTVAPEIALGPDGNPHVVWIQKRPAVPVAEGEHSHLAADDLYYSRAIGGGDGFTTPIRVNPVPGEVWGFAVSNPQIVVDEDGVIHVLYPANATASHADRGIVVNRYTRSTDGGKTFSEPVTLNDPNLDVSQGSFLHGGLGQAHVFAAIGAAPGGRVFSYWIDTRHMQSDKESGAIYGAISEDNGATFGEEFLIWKNTACPCCQLTVAAASADDVYLGYRQVLGKTRDSVVARSNDGGRTFAKPLSIVNTPWEIEGCPLKPTTVAVAGDHVAAVWYSGSEDPRGAYFSYSADGGKTFARGKPIHDGATISDAPVVWLDDTGTVVLAWHAKTKEGRAVYWKTSSDFGESFTQAERLSAQGRRAANPGMAKNGLGPVHLVFEQQGQVIYRQLEVGQRLAGR